MQIPKRPNFSFNLDFRLSLLLFFALFAGFFTGALILGKANKNLDKRIYEMKENSRPAEIEIITIEDPGCDNCYNIKPIIEAIKKENIKLKSEETISSKSEDGMKLIKDFQIPKLPTFIVKGEIEKDSSLKELWTKIGKIKNDAFVFNLVGNPYIDSASGEKRGEVKLIKISYKNCKECYNVNLYEGLAQQFQLGVAEKEEIDYGTAEGRNFVSKYGIEAIPTVAITGNVEEYPVLKNFGEIKNNVFIFTKVNAPYFSVKSGRTRGFVNIISLTDASCSECYDTSVYESVAKQFGLYVKDKNAFDISSADGKSLVKKYGIQLVPTMIITGDIDAYTQLKSIWPKIGTIEKSGEYVLRNGIEQLGTHKNLISNEIIKR